MDKTSELDSIFLLTYNKMMNDMRMEFIENVKFYNSFKKEGISISEAKSYFAKRINEHIDTKTIRVPTLDKYVLLNTNQIGFKNKTALNTVRLFLKDYPNTTFQSLKETFEIDTSLKRLFKEIEHIEEKDIKPIKRYFYKEDEKLITGDGVEIALTTQFGLNFSIFISISKSLGYQIIPYAET